MVQDQVQAHAQAVVEAAVRAAASPALPSVQVYLDTATLRYFVVGTRCLIRLRAVNDSILPLQTVELWAQVEGHAPLPTVRWSSLALGQAAVQSLWLLPDVAGFFELSGVLHVCDQQQTRSFYHFEGLPFRVGTASDAARVSIVNIDQSAARVVDNSRTNFAAPTEASGGLVSDGDFLAVTLHAMTVEEAAARVPSLSAYVKVSVPVTPSSTQLGAGSHFDEPSVQPLLRTTGRSVFSPFTIQAAHGQYDVTAPLSQGDLATLYQGVRQVGDSGYEERVVVKISDDKADNDLIQAEVSALALLCAESSPQQKHLPVILDQFHTRDGRLGTVMKYIDGYDLMAVRERMPGGVGTQHIIWIMRRCLSVLGHAHAKGVLHGNIDPAHILIRPRDHNVWLIDWCYAIVSPKQTGQTFRCLNEVYSPPEVAARKPPLPSSDMYALGKSMFYALAGDPTRKQLPASADVDARLERFLQFFVMESPLTRASDAWLEYRNIERLREEIWGPHRFVELVL